MTKITGLPVLPPRHMLGYLGSTMSYTEAPNAQEQLKKFVELCQTHQMPCDLFHLSSGYSTGKDGKRYVFTWNNDKVPDPKQMTKSFHDGGIKLAANIKPWLLTTHPDYESFLKKNAFIGKKTDGQSYSPELTTLWSGGAFQSSDGAYFDFTNLDAYQWWKNKAKEQLLDYGIDMLWNDNNEFEIWDGDAICDGFARYNNDYSQIPIGLIRPIQTLLMNRGSFEAQLEHSPTKRPFVLTRSGCPGIQRYAQTWSGDNYTNWQSLKYNIPMGLSLSISGLFNTGHDTGGFAGPKPDAELFLRWIQNTIFNPRFCVHSWNSDSTVNELWMYPDIIDHTRELIEFRCQLIPYLYTMLYRGTKYGTPIIKPLVYEYPHDRNVYEQSFDFMCGDALLVSSVVEPNAAIKRTYLPKSETWYEFHTGCVHHGGTVAEVDVSDQKRIPLYVRAGSLIPMQLGDRLKVLAYLDTAFDHEHGSHEYTFDLFDDDGETNLTHPSYGSTIIRCSVIVHPTTLEIECSARIHEKTGNYTPRWNQVQFEIILPVGQGTIKPIPLRDITNVKQSTSLVSYLLTEQSLLVLLNIEI
jgi:alpha-glucosidase